MKIELVKEERIDGKTVYYTKVDDRFIDGSLEFDEDKAKKKFQYIVENKSGNPVETILESVEL